MASSRTETEKGDGRLQLLGRFRLEWAGAEVRLPGHSASLVAYLAVQARPVHRSVVAGTFWADYPEPRALASLRSALHRISAPVVIRVDDVLWLQPSLQIDLHDASQLARALLLATQPPVDIADVAVTLSQELLPDDDGQWIQAERERFRHLRQRALDAVAALLTAADRGAEAVDVAHLAVAIEPTSETAEFALIRALIAEGNEALALREYIAFRRRLWQELKVRPAQDLDQLRQSARALRAAPPLSRT